MDETQKNILTHAYTYVHAGHINRIAHGVLSEGGTPGCPTVDCHGILSSIHGCNAPGYAADDCKGEKAGGRVRV